MGERILAAVILAMATRRGEIRLGESDVLLYNTPPRPYASGVALMSLADLFRFHFVPPLEETEDWTFHERIENSFQMALVTGIDVIGSMTTVLVKIGERFAQGAGGTRLSRHLLHPRALLHCRHIDQSALPQVSVKDILVDVLTIRRSPHAESE